MTNLTSFAGRWRIMSMELWDTDAIDLVESGFIEFNQDSSGQFGFIAVRGWMDCRAATRDGRPCVEFTWEGSDEGDRVSGRGFAALTDEGTLDGRIFFHLGDDSAFQASLRRPSRPPSAPRRDDDKRRPGASARSPYKRRSKTSFVRYAVSFSDTYLRTIDGVVDSSGYGWWQRDEDDPAAFTAGSQDAVAVSLTEVGDVGPAGFEDP